MKLKLDENLGERGADLLRIAGHDVATVYSQQLVTSSDDVVIDVCRQERRCLVTLDLDFSNPFLFPPDQFAGIAVLRFGTRVTKSQLKTAIQTLTTHLARRDIFGELWIVEPGRVREYDPDQ